MSLENQRKMCDHLVDVYVGLGQWNFAWCEGYIMGCQSAGLITSDEADYMLHTWLPGYKNMESQAQLNDTELREFDTVGDLINYLEPHRHRILIIDDDGNTASPDSECIRLWNENDAESPMALVVNKLAFFTRECNSSGGV